jgi:hypothetical protein
MSFAISVPSIEEPDAKITSSSFWPAIDPEAIREYQRIDETVTPQRLRMALIEAMASVNAELADFRRTQMASGIQMLTDIDADQIDDVSILVQRYTRAVGCTAKALLLERYRDYDSTAKGDRQADALRDPIDDLRRDARWAISDILGVCRSTVDLI